jgi:hypothetical protein
MESGSASQKEKHIIGLSDASKRAVPKVELRGKEFA